MFVISLIANFLLAFGYFFFSRTIAVRTGEFFAGAKISSLEDVYLPVLLGAVIAFVALISQRLLTTTWSTYFLNIAVLIAAAAICWFAHPNRNAPNLDASFLGVEIGIRTGVALIGFLIISFLFWTYQKFV